MESIAEIGKRLEPSMLQPGRHTREQRPSPDDCADCGDNGWVQSGAGVKPCRCQAEKKIALELPLRYRAAALDNFPTPTRRAVNAWLENPADGLLLSGAAGTGKTHLAAAIVRVCILKSRRATFRRCADLYLAVRKTYRENSREDEESAFREYFAAPFLVLDDMGAGSLSDHERRCTLEVLDRRINDCRPTIVTTNWDLDAISSQLDDRIASRLASFTHIEIAGADRRLSLPPLPKNPGQTESAGR